MDRDLAVAMKIGQNLEGVTQQQSQNYAFLKQYFDKCRQVQTQLSREAAQYLKDFYIKLRRQQSELDITVRQLEALIRISESIAKLHLRQTVLLSDAEKAVQLYKVSTGDTSQVGLQDILGKVSAL